MTRAQLHEVPESGCGGVTSTSSRLSAQVNLRREMRPMAFVDPGAFLVTHCPDPEKDLSHRYLRRASPPTGHECHFRQGEAPDTHSSDRALEVPVNLSLSLVWDNDLNLR